MRLVFLICLMFAAHYSFCQDSTIVLRCGKVETEAQYPGGKKALEAHFSKALKYRRKWNGTTNDSAIVLVRFVIDTDGNIQEAKILKGVNGIMNRYALQLVYTQKQWVPATQNGRKVKSYRKREIKFR